MSDPKQVQPSMRNIIVKHLDSEPIKCYRVNCVCTHKECDAGWITESFIYQEEKRANGQSNMVSTEYAGVRPCPTCDPERAQIFATSKSPDELAIRLRARSHFKVAENYDNQEATKTRTL
jgi:hypothetical protein